MFEAKSCLDPKFKLGYIILNYLKIVWQDIVYAVALAIQDIFFYTVLKLLKLSVSFAISSMIEVGK